MSTQYDQQISTVLSFMRELEAAAITLNQSYKSFKQDIDGIHLDDNELVSFYSSLQRAVRGTLETGNAQLANLYWRHKIEFIIGLMAFKKLSGNDFRGTDPSSGFGVQFGPEAGFFGKGRDWDSDYAPAAGAPANWIHSGSTQLAGVAGNPIQIGENVFHVIVGYGVYSDDRVRTLKFIEEINASRQPTIVAQEQLRNTKDFEYLKIRELDNARFLKNTTQYEVQVQNRLAMPASEYATVLGATFALQNILQQTDLGNQTSATLNSLGVLNVT